MKICVFADIHGNIEAFTKMYEVEKNEVDMFVFAGDIFGYFYGQQEIIEKFMSMDNLVAIKGNHEKYYLTEQDMEGCLDRYGSSYKLVITDEQRRYIGELPEKAKIKAEDKIIGVFHGGPKDLLEQRIYPDSAIELEDFDEQYDYLLLGHSHYRLLRKTENMTIINPGSLGQPRDGKGFSYCVLDTNSSTCIFKTVNIQTDNLLELVNKNDADKYVYKYLKNKYSKEEK